MLLRTFRRIFRTRLLPAVAAAIGVAAACAAGPAGPGVPLQVTLHARTIAPGEPLRIVAQSPVALRKLGAELLDREITMIRDPSFANGPGERWLGWSLVDLDDPPGPVELTLAGRTTADAAVHGALAIRIEPREFPHETLEVAPSFVDPPPEVAARRARERALLAAVYSRRSPGPPARSPFVRPLGGVPTSKFGARRTFNGVPRAPHPGLDLRAAEGSLVRASGAGEVVLARSLYFAGNTVILDHGGGLFTLYAHLSSIDVEPGTQVAPGDRVGLSGSTGRVTGPHLHWGAKIGDRPFDPRALTDPALFGATVSQRGR